MAWLKKFKGPKYPSTTAPQDATRTNYTPTFQNPTYANVRKINFANSPEQYEINSNTGQTTGRGGLEDATLDAMMALDLPLALGKAAARGIVKNIIPNVYRINPLAYHYNLPKDVMWRGLGKEGMEDAVKSEVFRAKQDVIPEYYPGSKLQLNKSFGTNPYFTPKFKTASTYGDDFIAEVPTNAANWKQRYGNKNWSQIADRPIPINEGRILQKDWLRGYKEIPKQAEGGVISNLRSQLNLKPKEKATFDHVMQLYENLNLGNFNKEISDYLTSINDEEELLTHLNKFDEGGIQGRPLISQRPPQFMANQVPLYSTDNNTEVAPEMAPSRLPDPIVEMVEPTIAAPIPIVSPAKPVKQPLLNTTSGTHIATPSAVDKRTLPKPVKPILNSARKVEAKIESTPVKPLQKSTVTNITKSTSKLPSDALQVLEEKSKNPAWASFKGKYSIYSKENSTLYLFDNNHKLVDQIVAGRGMTKGDFPNTADAHKSAKSNKLKATTPAGSYAIWEERKNSPKSGYGNKTYIYGQPNEAGTATALHDAWGKGNNDEEYARRMAILNDPKIKEKLFSYGCINIPTGWLDKNDANINVGDSVFITPEPMQINLLGKR